MDTQPEQAQPEDQAPDAAEQAAAEQAATLAHTEELPDPGFSRRELLHELELMRRERNEAFAELESWRQGSLIAAALAVAGVLIFFWPF